MLASRRAATSSCERVSRNGAPARMSLAIRVGASSPATGAGIRPRPRWDVGVATVLVWQAAERVVRGLLLPAGGKEAGLPAAQPALVAEQEPEHHRDPRVLAGDRVGLRQVLGLLRPADAERPVGRAGLVAVLGDPELLVAVQLPEQLGQHGNVPEGDRLLALRLHRRRLVRPAV